MSDVHDHHWERRPDGTPVRVLRDAQTGRKWRVWAREVAPHPSAAPAPCLVFDAGDVMRRSWRVPDDWGRMPAAALLALPDGGGAAMPFPVHADDHRAVERRRVERRHAPRDVERRAIR